MAQMLPGLGAVAIEIMSFLENGEFTFDDMSSDGDNEVRTPTNEDRPPTSTPMRTSEGKKETQTTTVPESSSFASLGTNDTRTRTEGLPQRPVCEDRAEVPPVAPHRVVQGHDQGVHQGRGRVEKGSQSSGERGHKGPSTTSKGSSGKDEDQKGGKGSTRRGKSNPQGRDDRAGKRKGPGDRDNEGAGGTGATGIRKYMSN